MKNHNPTKNTKDKKSSASDGNKNFMGTISFSIIISKYYKFYSFDSRSSYVLLNTIYINQVDAHL